MTVLQWVGFAAGIVVVLGAFASVVGTLVVPRATTPRIARFTGRSVSRALGLVSRLRPTYEWRDRVLAWHGPLALLFMLVAWVAMLYLGYALMLLPSAGSFGSALDIAGSSLFTLGTSPPPHGAPTAISFIAAASGLIVVALEIAYLPVLYGAFNRRESLVSLLDNSGQPSWGPEILFRTELTDNRQSLAEFYGKWELWAADVAESHSTYGILTFLRSPQPMRSWVTGLLAVMDAAALNLAICPLTAPPNTRTFLGMGRATFTSTASTLTQRRLRFADGPGISREEFDEAITMLQDAGWELETGQDDAWEKFTQWRSGYAPAAYALADITCAPPALWSGPRSRFPKSIEAVPPFRDPVIEAELRALVPARRERRHREQHEHLEHHDAVHSKVHPKSRPRSQRAE